MKRNAWYILTTYASSMFDFAKAILLRVRYVYTYMLFGVDTMERERGGVG